VYMSDTSSITTEEPYGVETNLVKKTIVVKERETNDEFEFRIPTIADEVALGTRIRRLRRAIDPQDDGTGELDRDTMAYLRAMAYFEILHVSSSVDWVLTKLPDGKLIVDSLSFPPEKTNTVLFVAMSLYGQVQRFRFGGLAN